MRLKLKEEPREWIKFTIVWALIFSVGAWWFQRKGWIGLGTARVVFGAAAAAVALAFLNPRAVRPFYRAGMTGSFRVGQVMGGVLLTIIYLLLFLPLGLALRLAGKDPLEIRKPQDAASYWKDARPPSSFDRLF